MNVIAIGTKGMKEFKLMGPTDGCYVVILREAGSYDQKPRVYYKASGDFFEIVRDCAAWLEEKTPVVEDV
jgi:hypothetical protein